MQPVLDAIVESAARVCGIDDVVLRLREGNIMVLRAHFGPIAGTPVEISIDEPEYRWMREHGTLHIPDVSAQRTIFQRWVLTAGSRTFLAVPLRQQGEFIGTLDARRTEVRPFTPAQIKLLETFADQAVIAIENVRLFQELKESLEQQTATSEILGVIASSPTDIQPVLDTVIARMRRVLCGAKQRSHSSGRRRVSATGGSLQREPMQALPVVEPGLSGRSRRSRRSRSSRRTIHIHDCRMCKRSFARSIRHGTTNGQREPCSLCPCCAKERPIGTIFIWRDGCRPFTDKQIDFSKPSPTRP